MSSQADMSKNNHRLMRLCHLDRRPEVSPYIAAQRLIDNNQILSDQRSRQIYNFCGVRAVSQRTTSQFCRFFSPRPMHASSDDL